MIERARLVEGPNGRLFLVETGELVEDDKVKEYAVDYPDDSSAWIVRFTRTELERLSNGYVICDWCPNVVRPGDPAHQTGDCYGRRHLRRDLDCDHAPSLYDSYCPRCNESIVEGRTA